VHVVSGTGEDSDHNIKRDSRQTFKSLNQCLYPFNQAILQPAFLAVCKIFLQRMSGVESA